MSTPEHVDAIDVAAATLLAEVKRRAAEIGGDPTLHISILLAAVGMAIVDSAQSEPVAVMHILDQWPPLLKVSIINAFSARQKVHR